MVMKNIISCSNQEDDSGRRAILVLGHRGWWSPGVTWPELGLWRRQPALSARLPGCSPSSSAGWSRTGPRGCFPRRWGRRPRTSALLDQMWHISSEQTGAMCNSTQSYSYWRYVRTNKVPAVSSTFRQNMAARSWHHKESFSFEMCAKMSVGVAPCWKN